MTKDDISLLFEYDRWANHRVLEAASALSREEFTRDLGGSFRSARDTLLHIIGGAWIWLSYWKAPAVSREFLADLRVRREGLFRAEAFPDVAAVGAKWAEVEREKMEFLEPLTDETANRMVSFRGKEIRLSLLMQHVVNHSTYHRGQVALMMRQLGAKPVATDFHEFIAQKMT
jgi:uncharacterized damage-inducible protein DinB